MINHRVQKYIEDHSFCSEYSFRDWEAFLDFIWRRRLSRFIHPSREHCKRIFSTDTADIPDPDDREWMYSETWLHEDGFEEKILRILRLIFVKRESMLVLFFGDKYISYDLVPSFYLADEQTPARRDIAGLRVACKGNSKMNYKVTDKEKYYRKGVFHIPRRLQVFDLNNSENRCDRTCHTFKEQ